jgi:hypothetical protein
VFAGVEKLQVLHVNDAATAVTSCPMRMLLSQNVPDWGQDVEEFFNMCMEEPSMKSIMMSRGFTHLALAAAGTGQRVYVTVAVGQCTAAASVKVS